MAPSVFGVGRVACLGGVTVADRGQLIVGSASWWRFRYPGK